MSALKQCMESLYYEVIPMKGYEAGLDHLNAGDKVGITCSPKQGIQYTLDTVAHIQPRGFQVTPHLAARQIKNRQHR